MSNTGVKVFGKMGTAKLNEMGQNSVVYEEFLKFHGRVFKRNTAEALEFFAQRPESAFIATAEQWSNQGYKIAFGCEAIRFTDNNGNHTDLFDFSQVEGDTPPSLWTLNDDNDALFKAKLGIAEKGNLIGGLIAQTLSKTQITNAMEALDIPMQDYIPFRTAYVGAVQTMIAGRLEIGGNKFAVTPDSTMFQAFYAQQKISFLTFVGNTARESLMKMEQTEKLIRQERVNENGKIQVRGRENHSTNDAAGVGLTHTRATGQHVDGRTPNRVTRGIAERNSLGADGAGQGRSAGLGVGDGRERSEGNAWIPRVQAERSNRADGVVQIRPDVGSVPHEHDGHGTIADSTANREVRDVVDGIHASKSPTFGIKNATESQLLDGGAVGGRNGVGTSGVVGLGVRENESAPDGLRGKNKLGEDAGVLHGRHGDEGESADSENSGLDKLNSIIESPIKKIGDLVSVTRDVVELQREFITVFTEGDYDRANEITEEIKELTQAASELKEKAQAEEITRKDVEALRSIEPKRKSVQNLLESEVAITPKFEKLLENELGSLSPYELRKSDTRSEEITLVPIVKVEKRDVSNVLSDVKNNAIERGSFLNNDTGMSVIFGRQGIKDSVAYAHMAIKRNIPVESRLSALYHMQEIIKNAICLDSRISEYDFKTAKSKSPNTLFMHGMYQSSTDFKTTVNEIPQNIKNSNAVFVHRNKDGEAVGGEVQGVNSFKRYKGVVAGTSGTAFTYTPNPTVDGKTKTAYLFESAIDLMSFYAFCKPEKMEGVTLVSMAGLKPTIAKQLQAEGVKVFSCVDNADDGRKFERTNNLQRPKNDLLVQAGVKDWNDLLKLRIENPNAVKDFVPEVEKPEKKNMFARRKVG